MAVRSTSDEPAAPAATALPLARPAGRPRKKFRSRWKRFLILVTGWLFVLLGILGLFLPILQGILFLAIGFYLLSLESPWVHRRMVQVRERYPRFGATMDDARVRAARIARRIRARRRWLRRRNHTNRV
jgi:hypothetical protein